MYFISYLGWLPNEGRGKKKERKNRFLIYISARFVFDEQTWKIQDGGIS